MNIYNYGSVLTEPGCGSEWDFMTRGCGVVVCRTLHAVEQRETGVRAVRMRPYVSFYASSSSRETRLGESIPANLVVE